MELMSKQDYSVHYWMVNLFTSIPMVSIVDGWPEGSLKLPTVALEEDTIYPVDFELGNSIRRKVRQYYIDIFAETKAQRNEIGYKLLNALDGKIPVYNYDNGFTSPEQIGVLDPTETAYKPIKVLPDLTEKLYFRATVSFSAEYMQI